MVSQVQSDVADRSRKFDEQRWALEEMIEGLRGGADRRDRDHALQEKRIQDLEADVRSLKGFQEEAQSRILETLSREVKAAGDSRHELEATIHRLQEEIKTQSAQHQHERTRLKQLIDELVVDAKRSAKREAEYSEEMHEIRLDNRQLREQQRQLQVAIQAVMSSVEELAEKKSEKRREGHHRSHRRSRITEQAEVPVITDEKPQEVSERKDNVPLQISAVEMHVALPPAEAVRYGVTAPDEAGSESVVIEDSDSPATPSESAQAPPPSISTIVAENSVSPIPDTSAPGLGSEPAALDLTTKTREESVDPHPIIPLSVLDTNKRTLVVLGCDSIATNRSLRLSPNRVSSDLINCSFVDTVARSTTVVTPFIDSDVSFTVGKFDYKYIRWQVLYTLATPGVGESVSRSGPVDCKFSIRRYELVPVCRTRKWVPYICG